MLTRIDRYLLRESLPPLLFGLLLYSCLAVVSTTLPRLQWIVGTPILRLGGWLALQLPTALEQTLPIALVLAVLLAFGRLGTDNELLAMQAGTVPLLRASAVFIAAGALAAFAALALNQWVLPQTNGMVAQQYWQLTAGSSGLFRLADQNVPVGDFTLRFQSAGPDDTMRGVRVEKWDGSKLTLLRARSARFQGTDLILAGYDVTVLDFSALDGARQGDPRQALSKLVRLINRPADPNATLTLTTSLTEKDLISRFSGGGFGDTRSIAGAWHDAHDQQLAYRDRRQAAVLFQRMLSEPFANVTLLLVAIPLALLYAGSRGIAFGLSLVVTLVWYVALTMGQLFSQTGALPVWLGPWLGNIVLGAIGIYLLARRVRLR
ncbi:MAG TPA: LptF/LptG family permease [Trueperaceae bacterium]|nr:LptF/LptG family permease [Trueperaceae bacterium]